MPSFSSVPTTGRSLTDPDALLRWHGHKLIDFYKNLQQLTLQLAEKKEMLRNAHQELRRSCPDLCSATVTELRCPAPMKADQPGKTLARALTALAAKRGVPEASIRAVCEAALKVDAASLGVAKLESSVILALEDLSELYHKEARSGELAGKTAEVCSCRKARADCLIIVLCCRQMKLAEMRHVSGDSGRSVELLEQAAMELSKVFGDREHPLVQVLRSTAQLRALATLRAPPHAADRCH